MQEALERLADMMNDPIIAARDPSSSLSFSCLEPEVAKSQEEGLRFYGQGLNKAFCPLRADGRPLRRSERLTSLCLSRP
jgi:hypothetical protein